MLRMTRAPRLKRGWMPSAQLGPDSVRNPARRCRATTGLEPDSARGPSSSRHVERDVIDAVERGDVHEIFGIFNSGGSNIAKHKDEYIAEAVDAAHPDET
jgi:hypothetical protein